MENFTPYLENNIDINEGYKRKNYVVRYNDTNNNFCYIYFASNGLYIKDDRNSFNQVINEQDKYEWKNLSAKLKPEKEIFIRDVWLSWYVKGINTTISDISKLIDFLQEETKEYKVVTVGNSSGGYIASIIAVKLNAYMCFNISGQYSLKNHNNNVNLNPLLNKYKNERGLYYESYLFIEKSEVPIVYLYPGEVDQDIQQSEFVKDLPNVYSFCFYSKLHGKTALPINFPRLLSMNRESIIRLHEKYKGKVINRYIFSCKISGVIQTFKYCIKRINKRLKRKY